MPSLWKREKSPSWVCCYTNAEGRRLKKSTKGAVRPFKGERNKDGSQKTASDKRSEAWEFCLAIERAERSARNGTLTEQTAQKIIGEIVERSTGEPFHSASASEWLEEWAAGKAQSRSRSTAERYHQVKRGFLESLGNREMLSLAHISPKDIRTYRDAELAAGKSPQTANLSGKIVSTAFNAALRLGYVPNNPCLGVESLPEKTAERSAFTGPQIAKLIAAADEEWIGAIMLGYFTGARLGDIANMRWEATDLKQRLLSFVPSKTRKAVTIPLRSELEKQLLKSPGVGKAFLFPSLAGRGTGGKSGLSGQFAKIMARAGIEGKITQHTAEGRKNSSLSFHSLRHSFNSAMANAGVAQEVRQKLTGHATTLANKTYTHIELRPLRAAVELIPSIG